VRNNIFANSSATGIQMRPGGVAEDNLFVKNAGAMWAGNFGEGYADRSSIYRRNVVLEGLDIGERVAGMGLQLWDPGGVIEDNIIAHNTKEGGSGVGYGIEIFGKTEGIAKEFTIRNNIVYDWRNSLLIASWSPHSGDSVVVSDNIFQDTGPVVNLNGQVLAFMPERSSNFQFSNNTYYTTKDTNKWVYLRGWFVPLSDWLNESGETGSTVEKVAFVDPSRSVASYNRSLGGQESYDAFMTEARKQQRGNYRENYTAKKVNEYIRAARVGRRAGRTERGSSGSLRFARALSFATCAWGGATSSV
jgi:hypothetical protein